MAQIESAVEHATPLARGLVGRSSLSASRLATVATVVALVGLTLGALWLRVTGLAGWDGTLSVDEARLALAARGVLEHGLPVLPSGWLYTRGLLASYLLAPSFALLGYTDFAARLPSALAGAVLVPVAYVLGRDLAGRPGGLFLAAFLGAHSSLVIWSRQAWFHALYTVLYTAALTFMVRACLRGRTRDELLAGVLVALTLFVHELGIFLVIPLALQVGARIWTARATPGRWRAPLAAVACVGFAGLTLGLLVTSLRAGTLVGSYGEIDEYFRPHVGFESFRFYGRMLFDSYGLVLLAALLGVPMAIVHRRLDALVLWLGLVPPFLHASFVIPRGPQERYGLTLLVVLAALAAQGVVLWATWIMRRRRPAPSARPRSGILAASFVAGIALAVILAVHLDIAGVVERGARSSREEAWLQESRTLGIGPDDLVMSDQPTVVGWYIGGLDFWVSSRDYHKYTVRRGDALRDVHTGAILIRNDGDFRRLVAQPNAGRTLWVIASGRSYQWGELVDDDLKAFLEKAAASRMSVGGGGRILRIDL